MPTAHEETPSRIHNLARSSRAQTATTLGRSAEDEESDENPEWWGRHSLTGGNSRKKPAELPFFYHGEDRTAPLESSTPWLRRSRVFTTAELLPVHLSFEAEHLPVLGAVRLERRAPGREVRAAGHWAA